MGQMELAMGLQDIELHRAVVHRKAAYRSVDLEKGELLCRGTFLERLEDDRRGCSDLCLRMDLCSRNDHLLDICCLLVADISMDLLADRQGQDADSSDQIQEASLGNDQLQASSDSDRQRASLGIDLLAFDNTDPLILGAVDISPCLAFSAAFEDIFLSLLEEHTDRDIRPSVCSDLAVDICRLLRVGDNDHLPTKDICQATAKSGIDRTHLDTCSVDHRGNALA